MSIDVLRLRAPQRSGRGATRRGAAGQLSSRLQVSTRAALALVRRAAVAGGLFALMGGAAMLAPQVRTLLDRPVSRVEVQGTLLHLDTAAVRSVLNGFDLSSLFALDLARMRNELQAMPWVQLASVRRVWPQTLQVRIVEQTPIAVWNGTQLVNEQGEVFSPADVSTFLGLPKLHGPEGSGEELMQAYQRYSLVLRRVNLQLASLHLDARGAWDIELSGNVRLRLGHDDVLARLQRFTLLHERQLATRMNEVAEVDARYEQGLAVRWKQAPDAGQGQADRTAS